jgi:DNA-binding response OmpR family regulator
MPTYDPTASGEAGHPFVLILERNVALRELLAQSMRNHAGLTPIAVGSRQQAEQVVRGVHVGAIVMDASWGDAETLLSILRGGKGATSALTVLMTTQGNAQELSLLGADMVIQKPFSAVQFARSLRTALDLPPVRQATIGQCQPE